MICVGLIFGGWQANIRWEQFKSVLAELEEKDPEKYAIMVDEAKSFHVKEAKSLYHEIETMTRETVITLRYENGEKKEKRMKNFMKNITTKNYWIESRFEKPSRQITSLVLMNYKSWNNANLSKLDLFTGKRRNPGNKGSFSMKNVWSMWKWN